MRRYPTRLIPEKFPVHCLTKQPPLHSKPTTTTESSPKISIKKTTNFSMKESKRRPIPVLCALFLVVTPHYREVLAFSTTSTPPSPSSRTDQRQPPFSVLRASTLDSETVNGAKKTDAAKNKKSSEPKSRSFADRMQASGMTAAAAAATAAVNAAVSMKTLEAPDLDKSYISMQRNLTTSDGRSRVDEEGLPLVYDKDVIEEYWKKQRGALNKRWGTFVGKAVPFLTKLTTLMIRDGTISEDEIPALSRQARIDLQDLGPTFIKAGQMMSVRPDVLPQSTLDELALLQDSVVPFDTEVAVQVIEEELGGPLGQFFTSISEEPVAAASLAQVYKATLNDGNDTQVAIKVQRPDVLGTVSKDLYVLRRAAEVWQGLVERFAPQQKTNYVALLNEWAIGFYTELDFINESRNQRKLRNLLKDNGIHNVVIPDVYDEYCTRRLLVSDWIEGKKLSECTPDQISEVTPDAQEAFLTQLFEVGYFHADPHPGNLLYLDDPTPEGAKVALIDCGLVASIDEFDRDNMISALIHLANKDYPALVDDFIQLKILPEDTNHAAVIPLMDKALSPYVKGGGAKKYEAEIRKLYGMEEGMSMQGQVGGFQAMTQDALTVLNDIPFQIPPYFALLGRAIVTLEGVALTGDPNFALIRSSYPFVARKLLRERRPGLQKALQEVLYSSTSSGEGSGLKLTRLLALLNNAAGAVDAKAGAAFVDLDSVPEDGLSVRESLKFLLSDNASSLRKLLQAETDSVVDVLSRQVFRRAVSEALVAITPPRPRSLPFLGDVFPQPPPFDEVPLPLLMPRVGNDRINRPSVGLMTLKEFTDTVAPKLNQDEDIYAIGLADGAREFFGPEIGDLLNGERILSPQSIQIFLEALRSGILGRRDLVSSDTAKAVIGFVENAVSFARRGTTRTKMESDLFEAIAELDESERTTLDEIVRDVTQRAIARAADRLSSVERIL